MAFGIAEGIGLASSVLGAFGKKKGSTQQTMPQIMPRAEKFYNLLEEDFIPRVYDKPYQTPFLMRYEPTNQYEESPILAKIQAAIDAQQMPQEEMPQEPQQDPAQMQMMIDAALGRQLVNNRQSPMFAPKNRVEMAAPWMTQGGGDADYAMMYRLSQNPMATAGNVVPDIGKQILSGMKRDGLKSAAGGHYYDMISKAAGG